MPHVRANFKLYFGDELFQQCRNEALNSPARYRRRLVTAMNELYRRYDRRFGINTPGPARSFGDQIKNQLISNTAQLRNIMHSTLKLRWGSASQKAFEDAFAIAESGVDVDPVEQMGAYLKLMNEQPAAVEIVPALLLYLADSFKIKSGIDFILQAENKIISSLQEGDRAYESQYSDLMASYSLLGRID